ncbi:phage tail tape measure protein, partial [Acinetobacter baumannii]
ATAAATRYAQAQAAVTAATNAQTAAQIKLNTATSIAGRLAKGAFGLIGGWAGVATLGVMGLAAAYSYFSNKAEEAKQKLAEQAKVAEKADEELKKLTGNDKAKAVNDLTTAFNTQNEALEKSSRAVGSALIDIENYARGNREVEKISQEARTGTISYTEAIERLNKIKLPTDLYENLKKQAAQYDDNASKASLSAEKLKLFGVEVSLAGNKAQNAAAQHQKQADALGNTATEAEKATKALQDYQAKQKDSVIDSIYKSGWLDKGYTVAQANAILELQKAKGMSAILSKDEIDSALRNLKIIEEQQEREDKLTEAKRKQTKEAAKQAVLLAGNNERVRNMLRVYQSFRNAGLGDKQARVMTAQVGRETDFRNEAMFGSHKDANNGYTNTGFLSWQKSRSTKLMQSLQGQGVLDKNGKIQQTQDALDAMAKHAVQEAMTDKSYSKSKAALLNDDLDYRSLERIVAKNFVGWDYDGKKLGKAKASQHLAKQDSYYNQLSKILGDNPEAALKAIGDLSKFEDEAYKARAKTLEEVKQLQATYDSETVARSKKREEEINKATILGQSNLIPKINERYDAEDKLAQKQFDFEVNGYKWTEEQKLDYTYETNSLRLVAEGKLSEDQRKVALDGLELQKQQELGLLKLAQEQRLFQAEQFMLGEMERIKKRYALEYDEISKITDLEERRRKMSAFQADFIRNGVGNPTIDQYDTSSQFLKSTNYTKPKQTNMQVLDEDYAQTYQKLKDNLAAVLESEKASYQERLEAQRVFKEARQQMEDEYYLKAVDARKSDYENQLMQLGSLTSQLDSYWSNMTGIVKNAAGEQSGLYKGMYIAQQAFAISSATISALQAYNQILASPWYLDVISKSTAANLVLGMGMANVGLIAGQTIAGFSDGGFTGSGRKYEPAGIVHKGEVVWSQEDIKRWGGVGLVEKMRKSANPEAFLNNNASADSVMRRAMMSSNAFIESQKQADIFNQPVQDTQIIYKGNRDTPKLASSANSDLFHDGKVYFSSNGLVQDRSNLDDVQDFTLGRTSRPQAEIMPSIEPASPTINFKIEVINQVSGATVEAEQLDEQTVRIIVTDELDKQLPRKVPKLV